MDFIECSEAGQNLGRIKLLLNTGSRAGIAAHCQKYTLHQEKVLVLRA